MKYLEILKNHLATFITIFTAIFFVLGHIAAFGYYNSWGVDYLAIAEPDTGLKFSLFAPVKTLLVALASAVLLFFLFAMNTKSEKLFTPLAKENPDLKSLVLRASNEALKPIIALLFLLFLFYFISAEPQKNMLKSKTFNPLLVKTSDKDADLSCVYLVGSVADFYLFAELDENIKMIPKSKVESIEFMFKGNPTDAKDDASRQKMKQFDIDKRENLEKLWREEWTKRCSKKSDFKNFNFRSL